MNDFKREIRLIKKRAKDDKRKVDYVIRNKTHELISLGALFEKVFASDDIDNSRIEMSRFVIELRKITNIDDPKIAFEKLESLLQKSRKL